MYYGRDGIRANAVSPGGYDPEGSGADSKFNKAYSRRTAVGRMMDNEDIKVQYAMRARPAKEGIFVQSLVGQIDALRDIHMNKRSARHLKIIIIHSTHCDWLT